MEMVDVVTCSYARKRNGVLADEIITDELVIEDDESDESHVGVVDVELEALLEDGAVALIGDRPRFLFCSVNNFISLAFIQFQRCNNNSNLHSR